MPVSPSSIGPNDAVMSADGRRRIGRQVPRHHLGDAPRAVHELEVRVPGQALGGEGLARRGRAAPRPADGRPRAATSGPYESFSRSAIDPPSAPLTNGTPGGALVHGGRPFACTRYLRGSFER